MYNSGHSPSKEIFTTWRSCRKGLSIWLRNGQPITEEDTTEHGPFSLAKRKLEDAMPPTNASGYKPQKQEALYKLNAYLNKQI